MPNVWLTALLKLPPAILGRQLLPLSLSHAAILADMRNAYWRGGEVNAGALIEAVDVCSRTWEQNTLHFSRPKLRPLRKLSARIMTGRQFAQAHAEFIDYLTDYTDAADREGGGTRTLSTPWPWRLAVFLIERGFTESQAWNMPVCRARCYYDAHDEMNGAEDIVERETAEICEMVAEANRLDAAGDNESAQKLWAEAQKRCDERRQA